jgi:hypothetical protein
VSSVQVSVRDAFGNVPDAATGGVGGFSAALSLWNETAGTKATVATVPLSPHMPGVVRGARNVLDTGLYEVHVTLNRVAVPGGLYNLTVYPAPPDAPHSGMQARLSNPALQTLRASACSSCSSSHLCKTALTAVTICDVGLLPTMHVTAWGGISDIIALSADRREHSGQR